MSQYREVFKPDPGPPPDPGLVFYTITVDDISKRLIHTTAEVIFVDKLLGPVQAIDVGKRLYRVQIGDGLWLWQVESELQREKRERDGR